MLNVCEELLSERLGVNSTETENEDCSELLLVEFAELTIDETIWVARLLSVVAVVALRLVVDELLEPARIDWLDALTVSVDFSSN